VQDHAIQAIELLEINREMVSEMVEIWLSSVSNKLNEVMKVLTVVTTVFIPLNLIAGVYGMNFKHMPELEWRWGYPAALLLMAAVATALLLVFRRKRWM
jgi:magnesium transporter